MCLCTQSHIKKKNCTVAEVSNRETQWTNRSLQLVHPFYDVYIGYLLYWVRRAAVAPKSNDLLAISTESTIEKVSVT